MESNSWVANAGLEHQRNLPKDTPSEVSQNNKTESFASNFNFEKLKSTNIICLPFAKHVLSTENKKINNIQ